MVFKQVCILLMLLALAESQKIPVGIQYVGNGYNVFKGDPLSGDRFDPGYTSNPIFQIKFSGDKTADGQWQVPRGVNLVSTSSCSLSFSSKILNSFEDFTKLLQTEVSFSLRVARFATFQASASYASVEKELKTTRNVVIATTSHCSVYKASIRFNSPPLDSSFVAELLKLPTTYSQVAYFNFFNKYGTHAIQEVEMGSKYGKITSISEEGSQSLKSQGIDATLAASASAFVASGSIDSSVKYSTDMAKKYSNVQKMEKTILIGAKPIAGKDILTWLSSSRESPMPLRSSVIPISDLMSSNYAQGLIPATKLEAYKANFIQAFNSYCDSYLKPNGIVPSCTIPNFARPPSTGSSLDGSCRLCARSCGGSFPEYGGSIIVGNTNQPKVNIYNDRCSGGLQGTKLNPTGDTQVNVCCKSGTQGVCRICSKCGGSFPNNGAGQFVGMIGYGDQCLGSTRVRSDMGDQMTLCCQNDFACSFCQSCGGNWKIETGVLNFGFNFDFYFPTRGQTCSGNIGMNKLLDGLKFCCKQ